MTRCIATFSLLGCLVLSSCTAPTDHKNDGPLILISIDAFRWDYLQQYSPPTLQRLSRTGVHARRMTASFPSKTFPCHYTLVTGLWPEHHGIVSNWFYDPSSPESFNMRKTETMWWAGGEPVWITAEKQGVRSACYYWPGAEAEIQRMRPTRFQPFSKEPSSIERVDGLLKWLALPIAERPQICTLYFDHVDTVSHKYGPMSPETDAAVLEDDAALAHLLDGLTKLGLGDAANLVIVSDHGMSETSPDQVVFFEDLMDLSQVRIEATGPFGGVRPNPGVDPATLVAEIRAKAPPQVQVYLRAEVPAHLHYRASDRIAPIVLIMDDHWCIERKTGWPKLRANYNKGSHGWDPTTPNMGALFIANGPAFRRGLTLDNVESVDVYHLLCAVLGITPAANDGSPNLARKILRR